MLSLINQCDVLVLSYGEMPSIAVFNLLSALNLPIIAVDGAIEQLEKFNLKASYVVGDMDSLKNGSLLQPYKKEQIFKYPTDKDDSDTTLALQLAYTKGFKKVLLVGGGGQRSDHFLSNLATINTVYAPLMWLTAYELIIGIEKKLQLKTRVNQTLSFYGFNLPIQVESSGLKWPLNSLSWQNNYIALSNRAILNTVDITVQGGKLLAFLPYQIVGDSIEWL